MSQWNKAYLEALEVPVWVPLSDPDVEKEQEPVSESVQQTEVSQDSEHFRFKLLHGDSKAKFAFVISADDELKAALGTFQQIQFAWQAWLDEPLSAALFQAVASSESGDDELIDIESFKGQLIDCRQSDEALEQASLSAPVLNFKHVDRKAWWQLLQRLH